MVLRANGDHDEPSVEQRMADDMILVIAKYRIRYDLSQMAMIGVIEMVKQQLMEASWDD